MIFGKVFLVLFAFAMHLLMLIKVFSRDIIQPDEVMMITFFTMVSLSTCWHFIINFKVKKKLPNLA